MKAEAQQGPTTTNPRASVRAAPGYGAHRTAHTLARVEDSGKCGVPTDPEGKLTSTYPIAGSVCRRPGNGGLPLDPFSPCAMGHLPPVTVMGQLRLATTSRRGPRPPHQIRDYGSAARTDGFGGSGPRTTGNGLRESRRASRARPNGTWPAFWNAMRRDHPVGAQDAWKTARHPASTKVDNGKRGSSVGSGYTTRQRLEVTPRPSLPSSSHFPARPRRVLRSRCNFM